MLSRSLLALGASLLAAVAATVYHLAAVYLGGALMAVAAFSRALAPAER